MWYTYEFGGCEYQKLTCGSLFFIFATYCLNCMGFVLPYGSISYLLQCIILGRFFLHLHCNVHSKNFKVHQSLNIIDLINLLYLV